MSSKMRTVKLYDEDGDFLAAVSVLVFDSLGMPQSIRFRDRVFARRLADPESERDFFELSVAHVDAAQIVAVR